MKKLFIYKLAIIIVMIGVGAYFYNILPDTIPTHWGMNGKPDQMGSKLGHIIMFPLISLGLIILFSLLPKLDPKRENYPKFEKAWEVFQFALLGFFAYIYFASICAGLYSDVNMNIFMLTGIGTLFVILGNYMGKIRQNYFVGIKLPWTLANEEVWNKTHRLGGRIFMLGGIVFFINAFLQFNSAWILGIVITSILIVPIVYSYYIFKKLKNAR